MSNFVHNISERLGNIRMSNAFTTVKAPIEKGVQSARDLAHKIEIKVRENPKSFAFGAALGSLAATGAAYYLMSGPSVPAVPVQPETEDVSSRLLQQALEKGSEAKDIATDTLAKTYNIALNGGNSVIELTKAGLKKSADWTVIGASKTAEFSSIAGGFVANTTSSIFNAFMDYSKAGVSKTGQFASFAGGSIANTTSNFFNSVVDLSKASASKTAEFTGYIQQSLNDAFSSASSGVSIMRNTAVDYSTATASNIYNTTVGYSKASASKTAEFTGYILQSLTDAFSSASSGISIMSKKAIDLPITTASNTYKTIADAYQTATKWYLSNLNIKEQEIEKPFNLTDFLFKTYIENKTSSAQTKGSISNISKKIENWTKLSLNSSLEDANLTKNISLRSNSTN